MFDFPKTIPVPRGCGEREPGGVYVECGLSSGGSPLEAFLVDPPLPPPEGKGKEELANKPQLWVRTARTDPDDPATEYVVMNPGTEQPIVDLLLWIGAEHYPYVSDSIEEVRRFGASRKLNPNLDLSQLTRYSRMILLHPSCRNTLWEQQAPPLRCAKAIPGHGACPMDEEEIEDEEEAWELELPEGKDEIVEQEDQTGPCLFKCWELIPEAVSVLTIPQGDGPPLCQREIGSTIYTYHPTGESAEGLQAGIFATLPITGFALIQFDDGSVNEKAKAKIVDAQEKNGAAALPFYETDK
jgi:hypothetical protein